MKTTHIERRRLLILAAVALASACGSGDASVADAGTAAEADDSPETTAAPETTDEPETTTSAPETTAAPETSGPDLDTTDGPPTSGNPTDADSTSTGDGVPTCDELLGPALDDPDRAAFEVLDVWRPLEYVEISVAMQVDDCPLPLGVDPLRSTTVGQGFLAGNHALTMTYDGVALPAESLDSSPLDLFWFVASNEQPPEIFRFEGSLAFPTSNWSVNLVNMNGGEMSAYSVEGSPADPDYELLAEGLGYGEMLSALVPASMATGARVRIDIDDVVIFEDNPQFFLDCDPGSWPAGSAMVGVIDTITGADTPGLNMIVGYGAGVEQCASPLVGDADPALATESPQAAVGAFRWSRRHGTLSARD